MNRKTLFILAALALLAACAWVPPHPDMSPGEIMWRKSVGIMR
ncbi:hypothetical protein [Hydrogenophaga sp. NFH-34]|nr:hypothetical protein [Hydrogenophaga sp. NFH-34]